MKTFVAFLFSVYCSMALADPSKPCTPQPKADAGPDKTIMVGDTVTVGTPALPDTHYKWTVVGVPQLHWNVAQVTVRGAHAGRLTFVVVATTKCGSVKDSMLLTVKPTPTPTPTPTPHPTPIPPTPTPTPPPHPTPTPIPPTPTPVPPTPTPPTPGVTWCFPAGAFPNDDISNAPVDSRSAQWLSIYGTSAVHLHPDFGTIYGIPVNYATNATPTFKFTFDYADESDPGPYPYTSSFKLEGTSPNCDGGDCHLLTLNTDNHKLFETWSTYPQSLKAGSGAVFDCSKALPGQRPVGWTSADAAGLPIAPLLIRYDEVAAGVIKHALRFTVNHTAHGYVAPATHQAGTSSDPGVPPMGIRVRLKKSFDISSFPAQSRIILQAMKTYGMVLADNGSNFYFQGDRDTRWNDDDLNSLKNVSADNFEAIQSGPVQQ
jgi:hypothetical protein